MKRKEAKRTKKQRRVYDKAGALTERILKCADYTAGEVLNVLILLGSQTGWADRTAQDQLLDALWDYRELEGEDTTEQFRERLVFDSLGVSIGELIVSFLKHPKPGHLFLLLDEPLRRFTTWLNSHSDDALRRLGARSAPAMARLVEEIGRHVGIPDAALEETAENEQGSNSGADIIALDEVPQ